LQGLTLLKVVIDLSKKEFAAGLSFVAIFYVCFLNNIIFKQFDFSKIECIKNCKRLKEQITEEKKLAEMKII